MRCQPRKLSGDTAFEQHSTYETTSDQVPKAVSQPPHSKTLRRFGRFTEALSDLQIAFVRYHLNEPIRKRPRGTSRRSVRTKSPPSNYDAWTPPNRLAFQIDGKWFLNFSSNDYLGLANHPALKEAAIRAVETFGAGSGASRLICGSLAPFHQLETALARLKKTEAALAFSSGYVAAHGVIAALLCKDDVIIFGQTRPCLHRGRREIERRKNPRLQSQRPG